MYPSSKHRPRPILYLRHILVICGLCTQAQRDGSDRQATIRLLLRHPTFLSDREMMLQHASDWREEAYLFFMSKLLSLR